MMKDKVQEFLDETAWEIAKLRALYDEWVAQEEKEELRSVKEELKQEKRMMYLKTIQTMRENGLSIKQISLFTSIFEKEIEEMAG